MYELLLFLLCGGSRAPYAEVTTAFEHRLVYLGFLLVPLLYLGLYFVFLNIRPIMTPNIQPIDPPDAFEVVAFSVMVGQIFETLKLHCCRPTAWSRLYRRKITSSLQTSRWLKSVLITPSYHNINIFFSIPGNKSIMFKNY
jgi:hypothetical protein